ncbi:DUF6538 domain-containing protein [Shewanella sp. GutDb-MelDb]|uniref:DUF6538 domain-containing protein n=1 Tax=Shewanella sp. GutDb-MelDb TaxID=2058316 RepID=UPI000C7C8180|nr:DUF6538 domain-containing protein [Shewanella sp. GutDb-MelDb]PKG58270.1 hypothetical protein CXF82_05430 [Shewanella sp. GutDb-MelDb]
MSKSKSVSSPYLFQSRHGIWYARIVVPEEQRSILGKREIRKSLATKDRLEAPRKSWKVLTQLRSVADDNADNGDVQVIDSTITTNIVDTPHKSSRLTQVIEEFCQEKLEQGAWSPHTEQVNRQVFKAMIKLTGDLRLIPPCIPDRY